jgi:uncharacterized membrane protein YhhN
MEKRGFFTSSLNRVILSVFFLFFIIFISTLDYRPYRFNEVIKIVPIISLAVLALVNISGKRKLYMTAALLLSAVGDVLLAQSGNRFFIYGLGAFAAAHCFYITAFLTNREKAEKKQFYYIVPLLIYSISYAFILYPGLNGLTIPVFVYLSVITVMGITSAGAGRNFMVFITGASLFIISDSLIALNTFLVRVPNSSLWIMITYYPAQLLLTLGMCLASQKSNSEQLPQA